MKLNDAIPMTLETESNWQSISLSIREKLEYIDKLTKVLKEKLAPVLREESDTDVPTEAFPRRDTSLETDLADILFFAEARLKALSDLVDRVKV
jgi:hypothetical protein